MKKFNVTVNGKTYAVEVEEVGAGHGGFTYQPVQQPAPVQQPVQSAPEAPKAPVQQAPKKEEPKAAVVGDGELMSAPMPGTILDIMVTEGQTVKKGEIILILEAMKMENELAAPVDGTVVKIYTSRGESINAGDSILTIA
jgi:biotin carboxyl carrier protein